MNLNRKKISAKIIILMLLMTSAFQVVANEQDTGLAEFKGSNRKLNDVYKQIIDRITPSEQIKLRKSQRAWIIFRDLDCEWASPGNILACMMDRTEIRTKELSEAYFFDMNHNYTSIEDELSEKKKNQ